MRLPAMVTAALLQFILAAVIVSIATPAHSDAGARYLYLVRHGYYDYEDERDADVGKALVPLGVAQARIVSGRLRALPVEMTALYSSTMTRARQTAAVIHEDFPELEWKKSRKLRECTMPTWREDVMKQLEPGEAEECIEQVEAAYDEFFVPSPDGERHDIVVCHGNVIRYFITRALNVDTMAWLGMSIANCSVTVIRVNPDGTTKLLMAGDVGHIPPNLQTGIDGIERVLTIPQD
jgi:serine/threonine-protein phosphatase PGAM5